MTESTLAHADVVLLVEPDDSVALALRCGLERAGHPVERVSTAAAALRRVDAGGLALVVLDVRLPDMRGERLAASVLQRRPEQPVLVMTQGHTFGLAQSARTVSRLAMPFCLRDLMVEVHALIGHAPGRDAVSRSRYDRTTSPCRGATAETVVGQVPQKVV